MKKLIAVILMVPSMAMAEYMSGNMLLQRIRSDDAFERLVALGYVMGVSDVGQGKIHCAGSQVTSGQARDVVRQYLERNPSVRDFSADTLVMAALQDAWPCPKDNKRRNGA